MFVKVVMAAVVVILSCASPIAQAAAAPSGVGVNYLTGEGMNQLNCDASDTAQIARDMTELKAIGIQWVRIETAMTAVSGLPDPPRCPRPAHAFDNLDNVLAGIAGIGAQPILDILAWHYPPADAARYKTWLAQLLAAAPTVGVFEIGNEENLNYRGESYPGANPNEEPYGWDFAATDFAAGDALGRCPSDAAKRRDLDAAVTRYVAWLADTYQGIKAAVPQATVILGGLSSWEPQCWLDELGALDAERYADAIGYHPYPRYTNTPAGGAGTLETLTAAMARWQKPLPIWVTEFGFTTNSAFGGATVSSEAEKAQYIAREAKLLRQKLAGPIVLYTARDAALTAADWQQQCPGTACPGGIGGYGLFEWDDGTLTVEPAAAAFGNADR